MSLDRSLKTSGNLAQHRSVLSRAERMVRLKERGEFNEERILGMPKVLNKKPSVGKKSKKKNEEEAA